jgi:hypothetical protein
MQGDRTLEILYKCIDKLNSENDRYEYANVSEEQKKSLLCFNHTATKTLRELVAEIDKKMFEGSKEDRNKANQAWLAYWEQDLAFHRKLIERQMTSVPLGNATIVGMSE